VTLESKKLGILGFGRIGRELAGMALGVRMEIHYRELNHLPPELEQGAIYHDSDDDLLRTVDVLSMHVPGREETQKWLNAERLATMKRGAIVVNTGRGPSVHDEALIAALKSGHIRAAGLDVFEGEPNVNPAYLTLENVALLPHLGSATIETRDAMGHRALDDLDAVLLKGTYPLHRVARTSQGRLLPDTGPVFRRDSGDKGSRAGPPLQARRDSFGIIAGSGGPPAPARVPSSSALIKRE
jgi:lactate dehydrogenase-like 2-hydroxyacid dehydrogenase